MSVCVCVTNTRADTLGMCCQARARTESTGGYVWHVCKRVGSAAHVARRDDRCSQRLYKWHSCCQETLVPNSTPGAPR